MLMPGFSVASPSAVLLELFTSQGCYSCPPAEKLFLERYVDKPGIIALELHVDYWDSLVYGGSSWKDPFSSKDYTARQVGYEATTLRNPYTPQVIVQGAYNASGTDRNNIDHAISEVKKLNLDKGWDIEFTRNGSSWQARVVSASGKAEGLVVTYLLRAITEVTGGENKGKLLANSNVVTSLRNSGLVSEGTELELTPGEGEGCAVILQLPAQGTVLGAWPCIQQPVGG